MDLSLPLRRVIRETMALAPHQPWTVQLLHRQLQQEFPTAKEFHITTALRWLHERGHTQQHRNEDWDRDEWRLTERGKEAARKDLEA